MVSLRSSTLKARHRPASAWVKPDEPIALNEGVPFVSRAVKPPKTKYPYQEWLNGEIHVLKKFQDFSCTAYSFINSVGNTIAVRLDGDLNLKRIDDETVEVHFTPWHPSNG